MNVETQTTIEDNAIADRDVILTVRHDADYSHSFRLQAGCVDEYMTRDEITRLRNILNKGLKTLASVTK